ncbi:MAG: ComEC/Rec2 family competence protein [Victivallales bacterium]|nr:ComEC/Rec2 family competence protein [Victivallales bacterium]
MPALLFLLGIINAILPRIIYPDISWIMEAAGILPLLFAGILLLPRFRFCVLLAATAAGFVSIHIHLAVAAASYQAVLGDRDRGARIKARVVDTSCCGQAVPWLPNPGLLTVKVLEIKLNASSDWQRTYGLTAVKLPPDCQRLNYGDLIIADGTFRTPDKHYLYQRNTVPENISRPLESGEMEMLPAPGSLQFRDYLRSRDIPRIFYCRKLTVNGLRTAGLYAPLLAVRNFLLAEVTAGIASLKCRNLLATLFFGCRQGLDYEDKANYIKSGTIHIFTVSGLHVGILAVILFWLLRPLPFRMRHLLVPALLLSYVLSTGLHPPAARAWLMIAIWSVCRALLLYIPALNIVFLSAALLLLKNPFYLRDMGFQFSFVVVGFLILSARNLREWETLGRELLDWIPPKYRNALVCGLQRGRRKILLSLAGCVVAWLASSGICLYYQGIYFPFSIFANFLLIPFVLLLFILVFIKLLFGFWSLISPVMAFPVEKTVRIIDGIAGISLDFFDATGAAVPGFAGLLVFYIALLLLITARRQLAFAAGLAGVAGMIFYWHFAGILARPSLVLLHGGGSQECALLILDPALDNAFMVNIPSYEAGQGAAAGLRRCGMSRINTLIFSGSRKDFCGGSAVFLRSAGVTAAVQLDPESRSRFFENSLAELAEQGAILKRGRSVAGGNEFYEYAGGNIRIIGKNQSFAIAYHSRDLHIKVSVSAFGNGRRLVELVFGNRKVLKLELLNSSVTTMREYSFGR